MKKLKQWLKRYSMDSILERRLKKFYSTDTMMQTTTLNTGTRFDRWILRKALLKRIDETAIEFKWIEKRNRLRKIYGLYRSYRKHNPENSIKTSFYLAKMSYDIYVESKGTTIVYTPYIPKTPVPEYIPYVPESLRRIN